MLIKERSCRWRDEFDEFVGGRLRCCLHLADRPPSGSAHEEPGELHDQRVLTEQFVALLVGALPRNVVLLGEASVDQVALEDRSRRGQDEGAVEVKDCGSGHNPQYSVSH